MRPKSLILLLLALGCGLVASIGISQVLEHRNQAPAAPEMEKILVATKDIKVNEPFTDKNVQLEDWPKEKVPTDAIRDAKELEAQRSGGSILVGEPIRKAKFAIDKRIEEIPHGYRVVAVPVDAVSSIGNLLQPGDRVDVVVSIKHMGSGVQGQVAKTILQNMRVFAVNDQWRPAEGNKSDESIMAKTVSLLATPDESETIALASELGRIRLVLRNPDDEQVAETQGTEEDEILRGKPGSKRDLAGNKTGGILDWLKQQQSPAPQTVVAPTPPPDPTEHFTMVVQKGDEISHIDFSRRDKDSRWQNNTDDAHTNGIPATGAAVSAPTPDPPSAPSTL